MTSDLPIHTQVVEELRSLFREGNTPSSLIKYILACHRGEPQAPSLIGRYFREAFGVSLVRLPADLSDILGNASRSFYLNVHLVHHMLAHRDYWDRERGSEIDGPGCWLDGLSATEEIELINQVQPGTVPELAASWEHLNVEAQTYIKRVMGNTNALHEKVLALARLAETLQERVAQLQNQLGHDQGRSSKGTSA
jgi:hypothetical protein